MAFADAFGWTPTQVADLTPSQQLMFCEYFEARKAAANGGGVDKRTGRPTVRLNSVDDLAILFGGSGG